jgi:hypothetical protein
LLRAGATIATVEARHASYLNLLNGDSSFPDVFDDLKPSSQVLDAAGGYIVECELRFPTALKRRTAFPVSVQC